MKDKTKTEIIAKIPPSQIIFLQAQLGAIETLTASEAHKIALENGCRRHSLESFKQLFLGGRVRQRFGSIQIVKVTRTGYVVQNINPEVPIEAKI